MPDAGHVASALAVAVAITVALRAIPFALRNAIADSALLAAVGRRMPLGAVAILAAYCLTGIDLAAPDHGLPALAGVAVTAGVHLWRRNVALSILAGTAVCLVLTHVITA